MVTEGPEEGLSTALACLANAQKVLRASLKNLAGLDADMHTSEKVIRKVYIASIYIHFERKETGSFHMNTWLIPGALCFEVQAIEIGGEGEM